MISCLTPEHFYSSFALAAIGAGVFKEFVEKIDDAAGGLVREFIAQFRREGFIVAKCHEQTKLSYRSRNRRPFRDPNRRLRLGRESVSYNRFFTESAAS